MKLAISLIALSAISASAAQPKPKTTPKPTQCAVQMPTPDGKAQSVVVDCNVYVLINYLQQEVTQLQTTKTDKVDHDAATRAFAHQKGDGEI